MKYSIFSLKNKARKQSLVLDVMRRSKKLARTRSPIVLNEIRRIEKDIKRLKQYLHL